MQNLWPLKQKHSLWFARLFEWIAVHLLFISRLNRLGIYANKFVIRLNGLGYPLWKKCSSFQTAWDVRLENLFKKICHLFKWLGLSVRKSYHPFEQLGLSVQRNLLSIRMAWAIRSKKKLSTIRATEAICSKINFSQVSISRQFRHQPLMSRYKVCLQMHHE